MQRNTIIAIAIAAVVAIYAINVFGIQRPAKALVENCKPQ